MTDQRIAVVGMALRMPGADTVEEFWARNLAGTSEVRRFTDAELRAAGTPEETLTREGFIAASATLDDARSFDAGYFGVSPREAASTDPQQRIFLEVAHHALEDSGYAGPGHQTGLRVGVFAGSGYHLYPLNSYLRHNIGTGPADVDHATGLQLAVSNAADFIATRVAFRLGLTGPAATVQSGCSTGLVAVYMATQALLSGDADLAIAGASAIHLPEVTGAQHVRGSILSPTGVCRAFDADADGTTAGNGVAALVLKRYDAAVADGDRIHAVILGVGINNDGDRKSAYAAPSEAGQVDVIRRALTVAGVSAADIGYVETHGTGTRKGDPIEFAALTAAFREDTTATGYCAIGSAKPVLGHTDAAAGMTGLFRAICAVKYGLIPPLVNFRRVNPAIDLEASPFHIPTEPTAWGDGTRIAGVTALGVGGTNTHAIVAEAPAPTGRAGTAEAAGPLPISAAHPDALRELASAYAGTLRGTPPHALADVLATARLGRRHSRHRLVAYGDTPGAFATALETFAGGRASSAYATGTAATVNPVFAYTGQGSAYTGMAQALYEAFPVFRDVIDEGISYADLALVPALLGTSTEAGASPETVVAQPALFVLQAAMTELWRDLGVRPAVVTGHSVGEFGALYAAGALSLADGVRLTSGRGALMQNGTRPGGMLAVQAGPETAEAILADCPDLVLAVVNGAESVVLSGAEDAVARGCELVASRGLRWQRLPVTRAFHSPLLEPVLGAYREFASTVDWLPVSVPFVSGLDGDRREAGWTPDPDYLVAQAREPVRFDAVVDAIAAVEGGLALELGPQATLTGLIRASSAGIEAVPTATRGGGTAAFHRAVGDLYRAGLALDWAALPVTGEPRRVALPPYPYRRDRHWIDAAPPIPAESKGESTMTTITPGFAPDVLELVTDSAARQLGCMPTDIDPDVSFATYGADSMLLVTMIRELDTRYGVRVSMRELFEEADTARKLAVLITARRTRGEAQVPEVARDVAPAPVAAPGSVGASQDVPEPISAPAGVSAPAPAPGDVPVAPSAAADSYEALAFAAYESARAARASAEAATAAARAVEQVALRFPVPATASTVTTVDTPVVTPEPATGVSMAASTPATAATRTPEPAALVAQAIPSERRSGRVSPASVHIPAQRVPMASERISAAPLIPTPASAATPTLASAAPTSTTPDFGLYFFGDYPDAGTSGTSVDSYTLLREAARFADVNGFYSVWLPERHFDSFGGLFPNPSVLAAALAAETTQVRINAGSVVLPLHDTVRVAEEWSMVDGLSNGRIGLGIASGWHPSDFVFYPDRFADRFASMYEQLTDLRRFWGGAPLTRRGGAGSDVDVRLYPRPVQSAPPMYTAIVGRPESFAEAARHDLGVVTNLMTQTVEQLADNIAHYRAVRAENGLDPDAGRVTVLMHTYLGEDMASAREEAYEPFRGYMRSSLKLFGQMAASLGLGSDVDKLDAEDLDFLFKRAYERYCGSRALIGSPRSARVIVDAVVAAGANEIAALVDFGMPADALRRGLPQLAALRESYATVEVPPVPEALSPGQERIWLAEQIQPEECAYNEPRAIRLTGPIDTDRLRSSLDSVVDRHPMLRTVFAERDGGPVRITRTGVAADFTVEDHTDADEDTVVREAMDAESIRRFDLEHGPLFVSRLLRFGAGHHVLILSFHHIIVDAVSATVLTRDLSAFYRGTPPPPLSPMVVGTDTGAVEDDLRYWTDRLTGDLPVLSMPTDRSRPAMLSAAGDADMSRLGPEVTDRLRDLAGGNSATLFMTLLAGIAVTLRRFTGQDEIVIGVPVAQRPEGSADQVGFYVNTLALRLDLSGDPDVASVLARVRAHTLDAYDHSEAPFETVLRGLRVERDTTRNPVFQVMAEYKNAEAFQLDLPGVTSLPLEIWRKRAMVDLAWHFTNGPEGVGCHLEYSTDLFDAATAARIGDYLRDTLTAMGTDPSARLSQLDGLSAEDSQLLDVWGSGPEQEPVYETIPALVAGRARVAPDAVAVSHGDTSMTYAQLASAADRLAQVLHDTDIGSGDVVAVWLPRGPQLIVAQLAIMKTGAAYLPLDPSLGDTRLAYILDDSRAKVTITDETIAGSLPAATPHLFLDPADPPAQVDTFVDLSDPQEPCYVIYTSGSTGRPKGVVVNHRSLANLCRWHHERFTLTAQDRGAMVCGQSFDASVFEIWPVLTAGASLAIADEDVRLSTKDLADWYTRTGCTISLLPTALGEELLRLPHDAQPPLRTLLIGGDALRRRPAPGLPYEVVNAYGPTEATVLVTTHRVDADTSEPVPIGSPIDNTRLHVRDASGRSTPVGVPGELHIAGEALAAGYLHAETLTAERFPTIDGERCYRTGDLVRWTNDGVLEFKGRLDDQVKVRGFRVEPGEVTSILRTLPVLADAAVLATRDAHGDTFLAGFVVPADGNGAGLVERVAEQVRDVLPAYLVPGTWTVLDRLPYDANGKLDRAALAGTPVSEPASSGDRVRIASDRLTALWTDAVGTPPLDQDTSFFAAGGHSISAMRLLNAVRVEFATDYPTAEFYRRPTIAAMAARLDTVTAPTGGGATTEPAETSGPMSIQQANLARGSQDAPERFNVAFQLNIVGELDPGTVRACLDALIERHHSLRSSFAETSGEWTQTVLPAYGMDVPVVDLRTLDASERTERVDALTRTEVLTPLDLAGGRPWRVTLFREGDTTWRLLLVVHHIVTDGWGMSLLISEFAELYTARLAGRAVELPDAGQSIDYAIRQRDSRDEAEVRRRLAYWTTRLKSVPVTIPLPYDRSPDEHPEKEGRIIRRHLPVALADRIRDVARQEHTTPFALLGTACGVYLADLTGQRELLLAAAYAARETKADETVLASLAGASFLEIHVDPERDFADLVAENHAAYLEGLAHHLSFFPVFDALREVRPAEEVPPPPLSAHFTYQSSLDVAISVPGLAIDVEEIPVTGPLGKAVFFCVPTPHGLEVGLGYDVDRLSPEGAWSWLDGFIETITRLCANPHAPVGKV